MRLSPGLDYDGVVGRQGKNFFSRESSELFYLCELIYSLYKNNNSVYAKEVNI